FRGEAVLRGLGAPVAKSDAFWSVSVQPPLARRSDVVLLGAGAAPTPSKQLAVPPKPILSRIVASVGHAPLSAVVTLTSATLPAVPDMAIVPVVSGVGRGDPMAPPPS